MAQQLKPLLSWNECEKVYAGTIAPPRRVVEAAIGSGEEYLALLESGGGLQHRSRFTIVALGAEKVLEVKEVEGAYNALSRFLGESECTLVPCRDTSMLLVSYEAVGDYERGLAPRLKRHEWPVILAFKPERLIVYDNASERAVVCPKGYTPAPGTGSIRGFKLGERIYGTPRESFEEWVRTAREEIGRGEIFQVVLSRVESAEYSGSMFDAYKRLSDINRSPYMYYASFAGKEIMGASPELLLKLERGRLETHPIAGTRPRGAGSRDVELEEDLLGDEKELAEHVMLIDLARNDLGSIAVPGTVEVTAYMDVEKYSHVQHIVSRVEALARPRLDFASALRAILPAGTVSGAPKPRAMEIISRLEEAPRGPYAGAIGLAGSRAGEVAIVIRSAWSLDGGVVEYRAGAGIVYDSEPYKEYLETEYKLKAIRKALGSFGGEREWTS